MLSAKTWQGEAVIQFCGVQLLCFLLGLTVAGLLQKAGFAAFQPPDGFGAVLLGTLGFQGMTWVLIPFFLRHHQVGWREAFGIRAPQLPHTLLMAGGTTLVILPVAWGLQIISGSVLTHIGWPLEEQAAVTLLTNAKSWWMQIYLGVFAVVLAPVAEEFIFRGVLYPFVKQAGSPRWAFLGVNALFALIHLDAETLVPLFAFALALTWLYERTGSLWAPISAHALFNAANLVVLHFSGPLNQFLQKVAHVLHLP